MISDARPLQPEFVPGDVRHRDPEVDALTASLDPILDGERATPTVLDGPSGTGKTCIARHIADRLQETSPEIHTQYVNCWEDYTRFKTLQQVLDGLGLAHDVHRQATPRDTLLDRLRENLDAPYVVVLDEIDQLREPAVLYDLYRTQGVALVLITNTAEELFARVEERVASRLRPATCIHFDRYGVDELVAILADRVRWGLHEDAVTKEQLRWIADAAAGDARVAITTLREAAQVADREGDERVTDSVLRAALPEAKAEIRRRSLEKLTPHQRTVYEVIETDGPLRPDAIYEAYCERVEDPRAERTVRNYLTKMRRYNLVTAEGRGKARTYRVTD